MSGLYPGSIDLTVRPERLSNFHVPGGQDRRTGAQYRADLEAETERSLMRSPRWRVGLPLADDERWPRLSSDQLGSRKGELPTKGRWL